MSKRIKRKIVVIDEEKCNGCGACIISCPEQAIQIVDTKKGPKAQLVKEFYCDGLGACIGSCPENAITIEERVAEPYNEEETIAHIKKVAPEMLETHLKHIREHSNDLSEHHLHKMPKSMTICPSAQAMSWEKDELTTDRRQQTTIPSELKQWPIQLHLVLPSAPYFKNADIIVVADCVPFAYSNFHQDFLKDKSIAIGCPKLDDTDVYLKKIKEIIEIAHPRSIKIIYMEVPCCFGLVHIVKEALKQTRKDITISEVKIGIKGNILTN